VIEPTQEQISAAERLRVSLHFINTPLTIARLVELVEDLQRRLEVLELKKWPLRK
jgi:selenocysteine lyase/cysteine desulfurase